MEVDEPSRCGVTELGSPVGPSDLFMVDSLPDRVSTAIHRLMLIACIDFAIDIACTRGRGGGGGWERVPCNKE